VGKVERLYPPIPFERFLARAGEQPSHARSVLWLIDRVQRWTRSPPRSRAPGRPRIRDVIIHFIRGDEREAFDDTGSTSQPTAGLRRWPHVNPCLEIPSTGAAGRGSRSSPLSGTRETPDAGQLLVSRMAADAERCRDVMSRQGRQPREPNPQGAVQAPGRTRSRQRRYIGCVGSCRPQAPVDDQDEPGQCTGSELRPSPAQLSE